MKAARTLRLSLGALALPAALSGIFRPGMYRRLLPEELVPGLVSQDLVAVPASLFLLAISARRAEPGPRMRGLALGTSGFFFYAYGIYAMERVYTPWYPAYLVLFGLALFAAASDTAALWSVPATLPRPMRRASLTFLAFNPLLFYPLWVARLVPLIRAGERPDALYSIYVLDLAFVMPLFVLVAAWTARDLPRGHVLAPALFFKGATLLLSVGLGGLLAPVFGLPMKTGETGFYLGLGFMFLLFTLAHLRALRVPGT